ncbi:lytic murein transglycosylase [Acetobacteraceae bacterium]|nr:lytic murein transglycosylase [Candidatus Parcubacteria bacterium]
MKTGPLRIIVLVLLGFGCITGGFSIFATTPQVEAQALSPEEKARLQAEYDKLQIEIAQWQKVLDDTKVKKNTLQGDVTLLNAQIKKAESEIKQRNNTITTLASEISEKQKNIATLEKRLEEGHTSLAQLLREKGELETTPLAMLMLTSQNFSDFFASADAIDVINRDLQIHFDELRGVRTQTQAEKEALNKKQNAELDAKHEVEVKKGVIKQSETEKTQLLNLTKKDEAAYSQVLADRQAKAAAIRAALFPLRDAAAIQFGTALTYAQAAQKSTGVDPALVLAILTQESNLGVNVGQCYLTNDATGAGNGKNTGRPFVNVMSPTRDVPPFLALSNQLGFDPHRQVVSCPIASAGGWGGAMGPAQFIASTWASYATRIAAARGVSVANPWDPQDAIMAMSLYLGDLGAGGGYSAQHTAAAKYYAGGGWATAGQAYANQVMAKVADIQKNVDFLKDN